MSRVAGEPSSPDMSIHIPSVLDHNHVLLHAQDNSIYIHKEKPISIPISMQVVVNTNA